MQYIIAARWMGVD